MRKEHAIHNEAACDFLLSSKRFNDWVVTTAFYSALHFIQHELFPLINAGKSYPDLNIYYGSVLRKKQKGLTKHHATLQLVGWLQV